MNPRFAIVMLIIAAAAALAVTVVVFISHGADKPAMSGEQKDTRDKFFGFSDKELPPIKKGQEMQPRW